jgi:hypothetical protein
VAWLIPLALMLIGIGAGVTGMFTHNTPLFVGGWVILAVATFGFMLALLLMLNGARRRRLQEEAKFEGTPPSWDEED